MKHLLSILACAITLPALADEPHITAASARGHSDDWQVSVTLAHPDTGWDHYADGWRVLDMEGRELGLRILAHPHEHEQPFTRSLGGIQIPKGTSQVQIQARCLVDGWGATLTTVTLP